MLTAVQKVRIGSDPMIDPMEHLAHIQEQREAVGFEIETDAQQNLDEEGRPMPLTDKQEIIRGGKRDLYLKFLNEESRIKAALGIWIPIDVVKLNSELNYQRELNDVETLEDLKAEVLAALEPPQIGDNGNGTKPE